MGHFHLNIIKEGRFFRHAVTSLVTSSLWKTFSLVICTWSSNVCCPIKAILTIAKFSKWRNCDVLANFFVKSVTGNWVCYLDRYENALPFELLIYARAQILLFWYIFRHDNAIDDAISTIVYRHNHMSMVHLHMQLSDHILRRLKVMVKMCQFDLNMIIEGRCGRYAVTLLATSSLWKTFFMCNLHIFFPFLMPNEGHI